MSLRDLDIPIALNTSKDDLIKNFFIPLLENSSTYDRGVGYFSSSWLKNTLVGMSVFAENGGRARWITSPILSEQDWDAIVLGDSAKRDILLKQAIISELDRMKQHAHEDTLITLAWMIADEIIQFRLAKPRKKLSNEFHAKVGIFSDNEGNSLSFDGSYNDSEHGLLNFESVKVFKSWDQTSEFVLHEKRLFDSIWSNSDPNIEVFEIPAAITQDIVKIRDNSTRPYNKPGLNRIKLINEMNMELKIQPHIPDYIKLRDYQTEAIDAWNNNNCKGILEMATGTGKTITALVAIIKLLRENPGTLPVIICPYIHLGQQWKDVAETFGFRPILVAESQKTWLEKISKLSRDFSSNRIEYGMIITTNASFQRGKLREIIAEYDLWQRTAIIADEMHHCGTKEMLQILPEETQFRLGLSATPIRGYDDEGTQGMLNYFGDIVFRFGLSEAISQGFLTPYYYYPIPVYMKDSEFSEYVEISKKLTRLHPKPDEPISEAALLLAIKRARVQNNSRSKIEWVESNIPESADFTHTLFYVGDKSFSEILRIIGYDKKITAHEFTHRQTRKEREELLEKFYKGSIQAFVAMKCLDEGVDVPPTRTAYFLASSSVSREFVQRRGRILRKYPGKSSAVIFDLISVPPLEFLLRGRLDENYGIIRSATRREYIRINEFASLAENKHQAMSKFIVLADKLDLLDI